MVLTVTEENNGFFVTNLSRPAIPPASDGRIIFGSDAAGKTNVT